MLSSPLWIWFLGHTTKFMINQGHSSWWEEQMYHKPRSPAWRGVWLVPSTRHSYIYMNKYRFASWFSFVMCSSDLSVSSLERWWFLQNCVHYLEKQTSVSETFKAEWMLFHKKCWSFGVSLLKQIATFYAGWSFCIQVIPMKA